MFPKVPADLLPNLSLLHLPQCLHISRIREQYVIKGGNPLVGEVEIAGAKNAALAILSAAIMTDETILIENLPDVRDINV